MITKSEINDIGFLKVIGSANFSKQGWILWAMEVEGGLYTKVAIKPDRNDDNSNFDKWEYFYDLDSLKDFLYKQENLPHLEKCLSASYPSNMYNNELFSPPDTGYIS